MSVLSHMDRNGDYHTSDTLLKIAIDLEMQNQIGRGGFGIYHSNYNKQQLQHIKNRMGLPMQSNMGIKEFHNYSSLATIIQEIIPAILFPKIINKYTSLHAAEMSIPSLSWAIQNKAMVSPKISGVDWMSGNFNFTGFDKIVFEILQNFVDEFILYDMIDNELTRKAGILWIDIHSGNYMVSKDYAKLINDKIKKVAHAGTAKRNRDKKNANSPILAHSDGGYDEAEEMVEELKDTMERVIKLIKPLPQITIIDYGLMSAVKGGKAEKEIAAFVNKLAPYATTNKLINNIISAIKSM